MSPKSPVQEFFKDRCVFVTGGSGFMGKVLVEKLLYSCPGIRTLYVLMRAKRGKLPQTRLEEMFKLPMFERLRREKPEQLKKLVPVVGDISSTGLGLSEDDKARLHRDVSVVFHGAATLKLEATLKDAVTMNLVGTNNILELCKGMKQLKVLVHLSTAFCHPDVEVLEERTYDSPVSPEDILRLCKWMDDKTLEVITPRILGPHPNTYTFTKRLAEKMVVDSYKDLPAVIARPSIVTPTDKEPVPGWVDSLNGPIGLSVGAGKGVIRSMHCKAHHHSEVIPADIAINALIALAWRCGSAPTKPRELPVFNLTVSSAKSMTWGEVLEHGRKLVKEYPFEMTIWYPDGNMRSSKFVHNLCVIFLHFLPAYIIDFLLVLFRQKRFMVRLQWKIQQGLEVLQYFTTREWFFKSENFVNLCDSLTEFDKKEFHTDFQNIDILQYLKTGYLGSRQYCMKEDPSTIPRCRVVLKFLYVLDKLWSLFFYGMLLWLVVSYSETARHILDYTVEVMKKLPFVRGVLAEDLLAT